jgi:hypothetical protein
LVGCTQNGKSSLIRTILRYGGYMKEAAAVEIGIGNKSTTKYVSSHKVAINIRSHELNDEEGNAVPFVDEDTDIYDLVPESYPSGRHVHLLLVDTPGLDDSDNVEHEGREGSGPKAASSGPQMRSVDEMHKLAMLRALSAANVLLPADGSAPQPVIPIVEWVCVSRLRIQDAEPGRIAEACQQGL